MASHPNSSHRFFLVCSNDIFFQNKKKLGSGCLSLLCYLSRHLQGIGPDKNVVDLSGEVGQTWTI